MGRRPLACILGCVAWCRGHPSQKSGSLVLNKWQGSCKFENIITILSGEWQVHVLTLMFGVGSSYCDATQAQSWRPKGGSWGCCISTKGHHWNEPLWQHHDDAGGRSSISQDSLPRRYQVTNVSRFSQLLCAICPHCCHWTWLFASCSFHIRVSHSYACKCLGYCRAVLL